MPARTRAHYLLPSTFGKATLIGLIFNPCQISHLFVA
jgi:hypothetical protein